MHEDRGQSDFEFLQSLDFLAPNLATREFYIKGTKVFFKLNDYNFRQFPYNLSGYWKEIEETVITNNTIHRYYQDLNLTDFFHDLLHDVQSKMLYHLEWLSLIKP